MRSRERGTNLIPLLCADLVRHGLKRRPRLPNERHSGSALQAEGADSTGESGEKAQADISHQRNRNKFSRAVDRYRSYNS
jgi:hypothetical protein